MAAIVSPSVAMSTGGDSFSPGDLTPPHPTPATEVADELKSFHDLDLNAVDGELGPIQEDLNEAADEALLPSPPVQSLATSPAPSVAGRFAYRRRGISTLGDRLVRSLENRMRPACCKNQDCLSAPSVTSDPVDDEGHPDEGHPNEEPTSGGSIPIALRSPVFNPRYAEYFAASSPDLHSAKEAEIVDKVGDGVREKSIWAEEVMGDLERALKRLEQLADDEGDVDSNKPAAEHYLERLQAVLKAGDRKYPVEARQG